MPIMTTIILLIVLSPFIFMGLSAMVAIKNEKDKREEQENIRAIRKMMEEQNQN